MAIAINSIIIVLELIGLVLCGRRAGWKILQAENRGHNAVGGLQADVYVFEEVLPE